MEKRVACIKDGAWVNSGTAERTNGGVKLGGKVEEETENKNVQLPSRLENTVKMEIKM